MSQWSSIDARFWFSKLPDEHYLAWIVRTAPQSSEGELPLNVSGLDVIYDGRLRDAGDELAPAALAWFLAVCTGTPTVVKGHLIYDVDAGPRYRYDWTGTALVRLKGILDL